MGTVGQIVPIKVTTQVRTTIVPFCWLDGQHTASLVLEYMNGESIHGAYNGSIFPLNGQWYCRNCKARLDKVANGKP